MSKPPEYIPLYDPYDQIKDLEINKPEMSAKEQARLEIAQEITSDPNLEDEILTQINTWVDIPFIPEPIERKIFETAWEVIKSVLVDRVLKEGSDINTS